MPEFALPMFETLAERVTDCSAVAEVGVMGPAVRSGRAGAETVTAVHAPQLLDSLLSATIFPMSAQARI
jgi:hypothetical protein